MLVGMHLPKVSQCKDLTRDRANGAAVTIESLAAVFFYIGGIYCYVSDVLNFRTLN